MACLITNGIHKQEKVKRDHREREFIDTVKKFNADFTNNIRNAMKDVKKAMLKKCISEVIVDREANKFRFEIRKVPAVTPELEKHFATKKPLTISLANLVSATSSGGRICTAPTEIEHPILIVKDCYY